MMDAILDTIFSIIKSLVELLPVYSPDESTSQHVFNFWARIAQVDNYFPVVEVWYCMTVILVFESVVVVARPILKFIRLS